MRRLVLPILTACSLALCCAALALWVRSHWTADGIAYVRHDLPATPAEYEARYLVSKRGEITLRAIDFTFADPKLSARFTTVASETAGLSYQRDMSLTPFGGGGNATRYYGFHWTSPRPVPMSGAASNTASARRGATSKPAMSATIWEVGVPHWFVALTFAVAPAVWIVRKLKLLYRRRRPPGMCHNCGYDLRASGERCPECGHLRPSLFPDSGYNST